MKTILQAINLTTAAFGNIMVMVVAKAKLEKCSQCWMIPLNNLAATEKEGRKTIFRIMNNSRFSFPHYSTLGAPVCCCYIALVYVCIHSIQKNVVSTQQGYSEFGSFKTRHDASLENCTVGHFGAKSAKYK